MFRFKNNNCVFMTIIGVALLGAIGLACETDDDAGEASDNGDVSDDDEWCDVETDEHNACAAECEAGWEPCYNECEYAMPAEKGACQEACETDLVTCRDDCDEAYPDVACPDEGNSPADNPTVDEDDDDEGDDDSSGP